MSSPKSDFHVPGAYHFDNQPWPVSALCANVYLPPASPSISNSGLNSEKSTASFYTERAAPYDEESCTFVNTKRKRPVEDSRESTPQVEWQSKSTKKAENLPLPTYMEGESPEKLLEGRARDCIQYTLAGQIETFDTSASSAVEDSTYSEIEYRRALGPVRSYETTARTMCPGTDLISEPQALEHWTIFHALGNVVGKVWEFCRGGSFRGFYAGGGVGYDWDTGKPADECDTCSHGSGAPYIEHRMATEWPEVGERRKSRGSSTSFNGGGDSLKKGAETSRGRRAGKRRQVGAAGEELGRNWVLVEPDQARNNERRAAGSPPYRRTAAAGARMLARKPNAMKLQTSDIALRRISTPVSRLGGSPTHITGAWNRRVSHAGSSRMSMREPGSFVSSRCSSPSSPPIFDRSAFCQTTSRIPVSPLSGCATRTTNPFARATSPALDLRSKKNNGAVPASPTHTTGRLSSAQKSQRRGHSMTAAVSYPRKDLGQQSFEVSVDASPRLDDEARQLAVRRAVAEMDADAKMETFNLRLQAMIRQGKEALGTAFEIDGDGDQEGWMDDD